MIASQASKLPSNLSIRGVCILSLRLVTIFRSNCQGGVISGQAEQSPDYPPLSPSLGIVINTRWLLSPSLQMLVLTTGMAITTQNHWNARITVTESQLFGTIAIFRLADEASGVVIDSSELVVLIGDMFSVQCTASAGPGSISALISHESHSDYRLWISSPKIDESIHVSDSPDKLFH